MTKDELWEKWSINIGNSREVMGQHSFLAALKEYGEHVKAEAVKVCIKSQAGDSRKQSRRDTAHNCAAAIEKMPLP